MRTGLKYTLVIFLLTLVYSGVAFDLYWRYGPAGMSLTMGGMLALPVLYGLLWLGYGGIDRELGLRGLAGSAAWVGAALFVTLAHYPPGLEWLGVRDAVVRWKERSSGLVEASILIVPPVLASFVSAWHAREMAQRLAVRGSRRTRG
jgi:hypothetical protein